VPDIPAWAPDSVRRETPFCVVATKMDRLGANERERSVAKYESSVGYDSLD